MAVQERLFTSDDLMHMPDDGNRYELNDGELIIMPPPNFDHAKLSAEMLIVLGGFVKSRDLGRVLGSDGGFLLHKDAASGRETVRVPDVSFISKARQSTQSGDKIYTGAPDLAVEVISPSETHKSIGDKLKNYFDYGVKVVWLIYPQAKTIDVYRSMDEVTTIESDSALDGGDLLPGFSLKLSDLFAVLN